MSETQSKHKSSDKYLLVRYGKMGHLGWFEHHENQIPKTEKYAVIKTDRGLELGEIVGSFNYRGGQFKATHEQVDEYYGKGKDNTPIAKGGTFVRFGTSQDVSESHHLEHSVKGEMETCRKFIEELKLPMKLVDAEHLFGGERIIFYFTSEGRVDFRELVKRLAKEYQTRIELRQIGSRDEARILADFETCGQQCCCQRFLKILEPVNMKMAKLQKATLDPSKISGHCGRLKCCLRYEDDTYRHLRNSLPKKGSTVKTPEGEAKVIDQQILTQLVIVQDEQGNRHAWPVEAINRAEAGEPEPEAAGPDYDQEELTDEEKEMFERLEDGQDGEKGSSSKNNKDRQQNNNDRRQGKGRDNSNKDAGRNNNKKRRGKKNSRRGRGGKKGPGRNNQSSEGGSS